MSEAYQDLLRGFTITARGAAVELPSDVRSINKWVEILPRAFLISGRIEQNTPRLEVLYGFEPYRVLPPRAMESVLIESTELAVNIDYTLLIEQN